MTDTITPIRSVRALRELADYLEGLPEDNPYIQGINETLSTVQSEGVLAFTEDGWFVEPLPPNGDPTRVLARLVSWML